mmetsp:Transcript_91318/g.221741  ORF Transcript_91318/g.221741 Transcript_91318/m.221741 type:complete len:228 (-) Transcript_91318:381-1064(-)
MTLIGLPVKMMVRMVSWYPAATVPFLWRGGAPASSEATKRVPTQTAPAPMLSDIARPRPSKTPPAATTRMGPPVSLEVLPRQRSTTFGIKMDVATSPVWPPPSPPCARRNKKNNPPNARSGKRRLPARLAKLPCCSPSETEMSTPFLARMSTSSGSLGRVTCARLPSTAVSCREVPSLANLTRSTLPPMTARMNSEYLQVLPSGRALGSATLVSGAVRESPESADCA